MTFIKVTCVYEKGEKAEYFVNVAQIHCFTPYDCQSFSTIITFADGTILRVEENPHEIADMIKRGGSLKEIKCPICESSDIKTERYSNDDHLTPEEAKQKAKPAAAYLRRYQDWRTGKDERTMTEAGIEPKELTAAIDQILDFFDEKGGGE